VTLQGSGGITGLPPTLVSSLTLTLGQQVTVRFPVTLTAESGRIINTAAATSSEITTPVTATAATSLQ